MIFNRFQLAICAVVGVALILPPTCAKAQLQPGPNLSPSGVPFTFSPRFGYIGPPAAFAPWPPPPRTPYYLPNSMPTYAFPRVPPPAAGLPVPLPPPPGLQAPPRRSGPPARLPRARPPIPPPCPDGCPREPSAAPPEQPALTPAVRTYDI